jgi:hypothetical protein
MYDIIHMHVNHKIMYIGPIPSFQLTKTVGVFFT